MTTAALAPGTTGGIRALAAARRSPFPGLPSPRWAPAGPYAAAGVLAGGIAIRTAFTVAAAASASTGGEVGALAATMLP